MELLGSLGEIQHTTENLVWQTPSTPSFSKCISIEDDDIDFTAPVRGRFPHRGSSSRSVESKTQPESPIGCSPQSPHTPAASQERSSGQGFLFHSRPPMNSAFLREIPCKALSLEDRSLSCPQTATNLHTKRHWGKAGRFVGRKNPAQCFWSQTASSPAE